MLYGLKLNKEELFILKKKGLVFLHFIWPKKFEKKLKWKYLSVKEGGGGRIYQ